MYWVAGSFVLYIHYTLLAMKRFILFSLQIFLLNIAVQAQKYTSLKSGNWDNTTDVWSTNGETPCGCNPGSVLNGDTIIVNHEVRPMANLSLAGSTNLRVNSSGSISNSLFDIVVDHSLILADGAISVNKLMVNTGGKFELTNTSLIVNSRILIKGTFTSINTNITVIGGNIQVYQGGQVFFGGSTNIFFHNGNYKNGGTTFVCNTCCLYLSQGNITNDSTGGFEGGGAVISELGNIKNFGSWDPALKWCASGTDFNLPETEDCPTANDICKSQPLPEELIIFAGYSGEEGNTLYWKTASETGGDHYKLESSLDGENWTQVDLIQSSNSGILVSSYTYFDRQIVKGLQYYRITLLNQNGDPVFTKSISVDAEFDQEILVFPNPVNDNATVRLQENHRFVTIKLFDAYGRLIEEKNIESEFNISIELPTQEGLYFLQAEGEYSTEKIPLVKI